MTISINLGVTLAIYVSIESQPKFAELIQRGANLWPDAPPEIKELADLVTNGKVLQDYKGQNNFRQPATAVAQPVADATSTGE